MTTAPTPAEAERIASLLKAYATTTDSDLLLLGETLLEAAELLTRLQADNERLRAEMNMPTIEDASQDWSKVDPAIAWHLIERHADSWADIGKMMTEYVQAQIARAELEARKPLPLSYRAGAMTSSVDGGATVSLHFNDMAEAEAWFVAITDQHDAALVDKSPNLQVGQRFWGFFHSTCIYESDAELISLHATKAGAWRAMHRAQWLAWEEVRTLQMAGRREPGWKAYVHEASHIGLVEVQP